MGDRHVALPAFGLGSLDSEIGLDPLHEPAQPLTQLGTGVIDRVVDDEAIQSLDGLSTLQPLDRGSDVADPAKIDAPVSECLLHRGRVVANRLGGRHAQMDLSLGQTHGLTDRQRDRRPFDLAPH